MPEELPPLDGSGDDDLDDEPEHVDQPATGSPSCRKHLAGGAERPEFSTWSSRAATAGGA